MDNKKIKIIRGFVVINESDEDLNVRLYPKKENKANENADDSESSAALNMNIKKATLSNKIFLNELKLKDATEFNLAIVKKIKVSRRVKLTEEEIKAEETKEGKENNDKPEETKEGKENNDKPAVTEEIKVVKIEDLINISKGNKVEEVIEKPKKITDEKMKIVEEEKEQEMDLTEEYELMYHPDGDVAMITISKDREESNRWVFNCNTTSHQRVGLINHAGMNAKVEISIPVELGDGVEQKFEKFCSTENISVGRTSVCNLRALGLPDMTVCHVKVVVSGGRDAESQPLLYSERSEYSKMYMLTGTTLFPNFRPCNLDKTPSL
ncbi:MAG: hypothetical protein ACRCSG_07380 [Cellulosilyticaceae bacterium]